MRETERAPRRRRRTCTPGAAAFGEFFGMLLCSAAIVYAVWSTVVAFAGGPLPLTQVHLAGGPLLGFAWIFVADPLIVSLALGVTYVLTVPIRLGCAWRYRRVSQQITRPVGAQREPDEIVVLPDAEHDGEPGEHRERPVPTARPRPDAVRPRADGARRGQPAGRQRELVGPDTP